MTEGKLKRGLSARHMTMISLGGSIGTGLFLASGGAISSAGPGGAFLAYLVTPEKVVFRDDSTSPKYFPGGYISCMFHSIALFDHLGRSSEVMNPDSQANPGF